MLLVLSLVLLVVGWAVNSRLKNKFKKYAQVQLSKDLTGAEIARKMLADHGIMDVQVTSVEGELTDHYNPANKTVNLSEGVYHGRNAAATAVAAHECGHAVQHADAYSMLTLRSTLVPVQNVSARILNFVMIAMLFGGFAIRGLFGMDTILLVMIVCSAMITLFALVTLPVEFDASRRALAWIRDRNIVTSEEYDMSKDSLKWAAMTYVVAALGAITLLAYYVMSYFGMRD